MVFHSSVPLVFGWLTLFFSCVLLVDSIWIGKRHLSVVYPCLPILALIDANEQQTHQAHLESIESPQMSSISVRRLQKELKEIHKDCPQGAPILKCLPRFLGRLTPFRIAIRHQAREGRRFPGVVSLVGGTW